MKRCPECRRDYHDDTLLYCLDDGSTLLEGPATVDPDEPLTARMPVPAKPSLPGSEAVTRSLDGAWVSQEINGHKLRWGVVAIVALVVLMGFSYGAYRFLSDSPTKASQRQAANVEIQRLSGDGRTRSPVISPDGKFLVYVKLEGGKQSLWIKQIQTGSNVNVVKPGESDEFWGIAFSPDGNFVYYNAGGHASSDSPTIFRVPTLGGTPTKFLQNAFQVQFSPDGSQISFRRVDPDTKRQTVLIARADGGEEREIASTEGARYFLTAAPWSPDGKLLAVGIGDDELKSATPVALSVSDGTISNIGMKRWPRLDDLVWHPSGDSLLAVASEDAFIPGQVWEVSYPDGVYRRLTNDVNGHYGVSVTADGRSAVTGELFARSAVWISPDLKPENAKPIMPATGDTWGISWTPDGHLVYASDQTGAIEIWKMNADGSDAKALTSDRIPKFVPAASPDGRYIVYTASSNGGEIVRIDIGGGNARTLTKESGADNPALSPDGKWVLYSAYIGGLPRVLRVSIDGGNEEVITPNDLASEPRYSNDGTRFACFLLDPKTLTWNKIAIFPADGGQPIKLLGVPGDTNSNRGPAWTPDDRNIVVVFAPGEKQNLWSIPVDGSPGKQLTDFDVPGIARREYSPDGKRIAIVRAEGFGNAIMIAGFR